MAHIPTKLHQFLISSCRDFVQTDRSTDVQTDTQKMPTKTINTCLQLLRNKLKNLVSDVAVDLLRMKHYAKLYVHALCNVALSW